MPRLVSSPCLTPSSPLAGASSAAVCAWPLRIAGPCQGHGRATGASTALQLSSLDHGLLAARATGAPAQDANTRLLVHLRQARLPHASLARLPCGVACRAAPHAVALFSSRDVGTFAPKCGAIRTIAAVTSSHHRWQPGLRELTLLDHGLMRGCSQSFAARRLVTCPNSQGHVLGAVRSPNQA